MKIQNQLSDYCSDDDIFLSPDKRNETSAKCSHKDPVRGIYEERVRRLKSRLAGIPRPPAESVNVYFNLDDVQLFLSGSKSKENDCSMEGSNNIERNKFGIYMNVDHSCEELERLAALFIEKYIPCETLSTMNDYSSYRLLTASAKKRRRCNGWASSPGSRLSYLARRKSTFSVDQVSKMGKPAPSKQFLLQRDQDCKGVKSVPLKPKRALFQSPDGDKNDNPFQTPDFDDRKRRVCRFSMPNPLPHSMRLSQEPKMNRKERSCRKSLEFTRDLEKDVNIRSNQSSDKRVKRKLLWAVSTALKSVSVTSSHPKFKLCMNKLFKASWAIWNEKCQDKKDCQENSFSTSEAMLVVAKSLLEDVVLPELEHMKIKCDKSLCTEDSDSNSYMEEGQNITQLSQNFVVSHCAVDSAEEPVPLRTLTELTNSNNYYIFANHTKEESQIQLKDSKSATELASLASAISYRSCEETDPINFDQQSNEKANSHCFSNKRKRNELDEEDLVDDVSIQNCHISKLTKKVCRNWKE